jgi:hypothetical protein
VRGVMSLLNGHNDGAGAREVLDFCLSNESPELTAKVYEIIGRSGLDPSDPMFLVLALTGQMRVFLEAAPADLNQLLSEWKQESASSLSKIDSAISLVKQTQLEQAEAIRANMEAVSSKYIAEMKQVGMDSTSAIAEANGETLEQVQRTQRQNEELLKSVKMLDAKIEADTHRSMENMNALIAWVNKTTQKQEAVNQQIALSVSGIDQIQRNKIWLKIADGFWSLPVLLALGLIWSGGTWMIASKKYNSPNTVFGRNLVEWNIDRLNHCQETNNPKCTLWRVPPGSPERQE